MPKMNISANSDSFSPNENLAKHIMNLAALSFHSEISKDESLKHYAGQLLTCITILSVAYLTPVQFAFSLSSCEKWQTFSGFLYALMILPLITALVLSLLSLTLHPAFLLDSPSKQYDFFDKEYSKIKENDNPLSALSLAKSYCDALEPEYQALYTKHNKMQRKLKIATYLVIGSAGIAILYLTSCFLMLL